MTGTSIANFSRSLLKMDSTTFSDADALIFLNIAYGRRILDILRLQVDRNANQIEAYTTLKSTVGLVDGNNGYMGEYAFPANLVRPVRMEVSYDGTNWSRCTVYDINENLNAEASETSINDTFSTANPVVEYRNNSFFLRPTKDDAGDITAGIHIWYEYRETEFSALTEIPTFESNLHDMLSFDIAEVKALNESFGTIWWNNFKRMKAEAENRFNEFYKSQMKKTKRLTSFNESYK